MSHQAPTPATIELKRELATLEIAWEDGHESTYGLRYLRGFCPCAHCQGHGKSGWKFVAVDDPSITKIEAKGNYAVSIDFSDGHTTGIYSFDTLRELCPCDSCQAEQGSTHAMQQYLA